jgi:hypothetical protein
MVVDTINEAFKVARERGRAGGFRNRLCPGDGLGVVGVACWLCGGSEAGRC